MKKVSGNIIEMMDNAEFDVFIHGCNCFCNFGGGVAKQIKDNFPAVYLADLATKKGDVGKLGTFSIAQLTKEDGKQIIVFNAYTQFNTFGKDVLVDYDALRNCFELIKEHTTPEQRIAYPAIGSGLAGGDWNIIEGIIDEVLRGRDHTLVEYKN